MYDSQDDRTVRMIVARGTKIPFRICKHCNRNIELGELCVRYKRPHRCKYHCYECAKTLNPVAVEEYHNYNNNNNNSNNNTRPKT